MQHVMAVAKVYTLVFIVVLLAAELLPSQYFGPQPSWLDKLLQLLPGFALLAIGWVWILHISRGVGRP